MHPDSFLGLRIGFFAALVSHPYKAAWMLHSLTLKVGFPPVRPIPLSHARRSFLPPELAAARTAPRIGANLDVKRPSDRRT
jgi:hypothetical protein